MRLWSPRAVMRLGAALAALWPLVSASADRFEPAWQIAAADAAAPGEVECWRSTERVGTAQAYRAYLAAFPDGLYAPLARAFIDKEGAAAAAPQASAPAAPRPAPRRPTAEKAGANLKDFSEGPPNSGALTFNIGDRFSGPGVLTIGWLGAKKQILLPAGQWVALGAKDHDSAHTPPVKMTIVRFGKFTGDRLSSMMSFSISRHVKSVRATQWSDLVACATPDPTALYQRDAGVSNWWRECVMIKAFAPRKFDDEVRANLERIGAKGFGTELVSTISFADDANGYLRVSRIDFPGIVLGAEAFGVQHWSVEALSKAPARDAYVKALTTWVEVYRKFAIEGFRRDFTQPDLVPGAAEPLASALRGVGDFNPIK